MNDSIKKVNMGVIICKHCNSHVDTIDTNRSATFYGVCDQPECRQLHSSTEVPLQLYID